MEEQKNQLEQQIILEQIKNPVLSCEQIAFFIDQYRKTDIHDEAQRQRLIDCFVNAVFVYDDKIVLTFNYKDGAKTIVLDDVNGSDMVDNGPPRRSKLHIACSDFFQKSERAHCAAPPFQIEPASLGFDLVLGAISKENRF